MSGFGKKIDYTKGATMGYGTGAVAPAPPKYGFAVAPAAAAVDTGKDPAGAAVADDDMKIDYTKVDMSETDNDLLSDAVNVGTGQAETDCSSESDCMPYKFNENGLPERCTNYDEPNCRLAGNYAEFYRRINWDELKNRADDLFQGFGTYCFKELKELSPIVLNRFRDIYPESDFRGDKMFKTIKAISSDNSKYCKDIIYSFRIPCGDGNHTTSVFHIALHSEMSHFKGLTRLRSGMGDVANCGYIDKKKPVRQGCEDGFGAFHYKIDSVRCLPANVRKTSDFCRSLEIATCDTPYKEFNYDRDTLEFKENHLPFLNPNKVFVDRPRFNNQIAKRYKTLIFLVHNYIYNLFVQYFNIKMREWGIILPHPARYFDDMAGIDDVRGAMATDIDGGRSIKRKSRRTRKSRKTKGSKKPRKSRKTRRLRKTRKLRK